MPTIPTTQRRVETAALPGARLTPEARPEQFGPVGAPLPDLSGPQRLAEQAYQAEVEKADRLAVLDADNRLAELQSSVEAAVRARKGKDAMGATAAAQEAWTAGIGDIGKGLASERQRATFESLVARRWQALHGAAEQHAEAEHDRYQTQAFASALENRANDAAGATDPATRTRAIDEGKTLLGYYARDNGWSPEQLAEKTRAFTTTVHVGVLDGLLAANDGQATQAAQEYFAAHRGEIDAAQAGKIERTLQVATTKAEGQRRADAILGATTSLGAALAEVKKITNVDVRDETAERVRREWQDRDLARRNESEQRYRAATNIIERTKRFSAIPATVLANLTLAERSSLRSYAEHLASGNPTTTDWATYYTLKTMAADPTQRAGFLGLNLMTVKGKLGESEWKDLVTDQAALRAAGERADAAAPRAAEERLQALDGFLSTTQVVDGVYAAAFGNPKDDDARVHDFRRAIDREVADEALAKGRKLTNDEVRTIAQAYVAKRVVEDAGVLWFDAEIPLIDVTYEQIPAAERTAIEAALTKRKRPVTPDEVLRLYRRGQAQRAMETPQ